MNAAQLARPITLTYVPAHSNVSICQCALPKKCGSNIPIPTFVSPAAKFGPLSALRYPTFLGCQFTRTHARTHLRIVHAPT